jgi:hypothetical protein
MLQKIKIQGVKLHILFWTNKMGFRMHSINPYKISDVNITPEIREAEKNKDVWNRLFDFEKYRVHTDALKVNFIFVLNNSFVDQYRYSFNGCRTLSSSEINEIVLYYS